MAGNSTTVKQSIDAPLQRAWDAWSTPAGMDAWFSTNTEMDFREGGSSTNGDGDRCEYIDIVPLERIQFSWQSNHHAPGSFVTVEFRIVDERVEVTLRHESLATQAEADDLNEGWSWALDSLKRYLETGKAIGFDEWKAEQQKDILVNGRS